MSDSREEDAAVPAAEPVKPSEAEGKKAELADGDLDKVAGGLAQASLHNAQQNIGRSLLQNQRPVVSSVGFDTDLKKP